MDDCEAERREKQKQEWQRLTDRIDALVRECTEAARRAGAPEPRAKLTLIKGGRDD